MTSCSGFADPGTAWTTASRIWGMRAPRFLPSFLYEIGTTLSPRLPLIAGASALIGPPRQGAPLVWGRRPLRFLCAGRFSCPRRPAEGSAGGPPEQREELGSGAGVLAKDPAVRRGDDPAPRLFDPAHGHAQMCGVDDDRGAAGAQALHQEVGDLRGQPLLH